MKLRKLSQTLTIKMKSYKTNYHKKDDNLQVKTFLSIVGGPISLS